MHRQSAPGTTTNPSYALSSYMKEGEGFDTYIEHLMYSRIFTDCIGQVLFVGMKEHSQF